MEPDALLDALRELCRAASQPEPLRSAPARRAVEGLEALELPDWLASDLPYYVGRALLLAGESEWGDAALAKLPDSSECVGEASQLQLSVLRTRPVRSPEDGERLGEEVLARQQRIVAQLPRSPLVRVVSERSTERAERAAWHQPFLVGHPPQVGTRHAWQRLLASAQRCESEGPLDLAGRLYRWSLEVRQPEEWLRTSAAGVWERAAACLSGCGELKPAQRLLCKALALPIPSRQRDAILDRLRELCVDPPEPDPPRAPRVDLLRDVGEELLAMELFGDSVDVFERAAEPARAAAAAEARATFLLRYRQARSPYTVLWGGFLDGPRIAEAFEEAGRRYRDLPDADHGVRRCEAGAARARGLAPPTPRSG